MRATSSSEPKSRRKKPSTSSGYHIRIPATPPFMRSLVLLLALPLALSAQAPQPPSASTGEQLFEARRFDEARAVFQQQLARDKSNANARYYIGRIDYAQGKSGDAVDWFEKAVQRDQTDA